MAGIRVKRPIARELRPLDSKVTAVQQPVVPAASIDETALLTSSAVFDQAWYELEAGRSFSGLEEAVVHYRNEGAAKQLSPHPLFDPTTVTKPPAGKTPLGAYLSQPKRQRAFSPPRMGRGRLSSPRARCGEARHMVRSGILRSGSPTRRNWTCTGWSVRHRFAGVTPRLGGMWR